MKTTRVWIVIFIDIKITLEEYTAWRDRVDKSLQGELLKRTLVVAKLKMQQCVSNQIGKIDKKLKSSEGDVQKVEVKVLAWILHLADWDWHTLCCTNKTKKAKIIGVGPPT